MFKGWWGKFLLIVLTGVFTIALIASWKGTFLEPLGKSGRHIRSGSRQYSGTRRRGYFFGGGIRSGK